MLAIIGAGFGLYGYLPALAGACQQSILLPKSYQPKLGKRAELAQFSGAIQWVEDVGTAVRYADGVVLALPPNYQLDYLRQCAMRPNIKHFLLEKPIAPDPVMAADAMDMLKNSGKIFRIGYIFRHTLWANWLAGVAASGDGEVNISWCFLAHHFRHELWNWKRSEKAGGGVIRFYGIQLIALLAELGYCDIDASESGGEARDTPDRWSARFVGPRLPACNVSIDSRAVTSKFRVEQTLPGSGSALANLGDPFGDGLPITIDNLDRRLIPLTAHCRSCLYESEPYYSWYDAVIKLWSRVEKCNVWRERLRTS
jgi:predicted dehydrogenase